MKHFCIKTNSALHGRQRPQVIRFRFYCNLMFRNPLIKIVMERIIEITKKIANLSFENKNVATSYGELKHSLEKVLSIIPGCVENAGILKCLCRCYRQLADIKDPDTLYLVQVQKYMLDCLPRISVENKDQ